ncbi:MAG: exopolyphosphatase [Desulfobacteraceae bacterium]|jgi:oligoribonuclease NrnB/cAMP/cGMP phosphodiesterase (DHH superfamily)
MMKRIITRPDFDGIVCAVLLRAVIGHHLEILWTQPGDMQHGRIEVGPGDIIANLPIWGNCALWFDHHVSNAPKASYNGLYRVAPSAAGLIYEYYQDEIDPRFQTLVRQADKIDDAQLNLDEILHPEKYPYLLLSMTISAKHASDFSYCDEIVKLLSTLSIDEVLSNPRVKRRCDGVLSKNRAYEVHLKKHTRTQGVISITDFRGIDPPPDGNRFLIYSLFPETVVNMKIFHENSKTVVKLGHSILNRGCNVNVGNLLSNFGGGGHRGAGACRIDEPEAEQVIQSILEALIANKLDS